MLAKLQERLFQLVRQRYADWDTKKLSGYVHGVVDGQRRDEPRREYLRLFQKQKPYAVGYIYGFIDTYGADAFFSDWIGDLDGITERSMEYRWWEDLLYREDTI